MGPMTTFLNKFVLKTIKTAMTTEVLSHRIIKILKVLHRRVITLSQNIFQLHIASLAAMIFLIHFTLG